MHNKKFNKVIILIPSYNDLYSLKKFLYKIKNKYNLLIIDDCSNDGTSKWLQKNKFNFLKNSKNLGYEKTLIKGFRFLLHLKKYNYILTMDADGEHKINNIRNILNYANKKNPDLIIGDRKKKNRILEHIISIYFNFIYKLKDPLSGFKLYKINILKKINFTNCHSHFLLDFLIKYLKICDKIFNISISTSIRNGKPKVGSFFKIQLKMLKILLLLFLNN